MATQQTIRVLGWLERTGDRPAKWVQAQLQQSLCVRDARLSQNCGCLFPNPVGLAAGFDKDGLAALLWSSLGFGFAELGQSHCTRNQGILVPACFVCRRLP